MSLFWWFQHLSCSWAEICQIFRCFFGKFKKSKRHSEINGPLAWMIAPRFLPLSLSATNLPWLCTGCTLSVFKNFMHRKLDIFIWGKEAKVVYVSIFKKRLSSFFLLVFLYDDVTDIQMLRANKTYIIHQCKKNDDNHCRILLLKSFLL